MPEKHAGKKGRCPKCKGVVHIPKSPTVNLRQRQDQVKAIKASSIDPAYESALLEMPPREESSNDVPKHISHIGQIESPVLREPDERSALPGWVDILLYPLNTAGIIHLIFLWLLVFLFCPSVMAYLGLGQEYIPVVYILPIAYVLYYFTECLRDSAAGHYRAPDFGLRPAMPDRWECVSELFIVLGSIALCFWPVAVYYVFTERVDWIYWLLLAWGVFFFPMVLLAAVLFDWTEALNPISILGAIGHTLLPYCGMVLLFLGGIVSLIKIDPHFVWSYRLPALPFVCKLLQLYLFSVLIGLLGRFYWTHREKLNWETTLSS